MPPRKRAEIIDIEPEKPARKWDMDLDELDAQVTEAIGSAPGFTIRLRNGDSVTIPHAICATDETATAVARVEEGEDLDQVENDDLRQELAGMLDADIFELVWKAVEPHVRVPGRTIDGHPAPPQSVRMARAILGDDAYDRFIAGGGNANRVIWAFRELNSIVDVEDPKSLKS